MDMEYRSGPCLAWSDYPYNMVLSRAIVSSVSSMEGKEGGLTKRIEAQT